MAIRGNKLREHILWVAKDAFLELGFERTTMDAVASRAETSKRSLYAYFASKEKLFLAVIDLVRGLFLGRLRMPGDYSETPSDALVMFCGRYLEIMIYEGSIQMCRVSMAEVTRFAEGATQYFDVVFVQVHARLTAYLKKSFGLSTRASADAANKLLGQVLHPRFPRALFGMDDLTKAFDREVLSPDFDLKPIKKAVADLIGSLPEVK